MQAFAYDANGVLLARGTVTDTTVYPSRALGTSIGGNYQKEITSADERLYFFFGGQRVAMEVGTLYYLAGDHPSASLRTCLGTTSVVLSSAGSLVAERRHVPCGEEWWTVGDGAVEFHSPTAMVPPNRWCTNLGGGVRQPGQPAGAPTPQTR